MPWSRCLILIRILPRYLPLTGTHLTPIPTGKQFPTPKPVCTPGSSNRHTYPTCIANPPPPLFLGPVNVFLLELPH